MIPGSVEQCLFGNRDAASVQFWCPHKWGSTGDRISGCVMHGFTVFFMEGCSFAMRLCRNQDVRVDDPFASDNQIFTWFSEIIGSHSTIALDFDRPVYFLEDK